MTGQNPVRISAARPDELLNSRFWNERFETNAGEQIVAAAKGLRLHDMTLRAPSRSIERVVALLGYALNLRTPKPRIVSLSELSTGIDNAIARFTEAIHSQHRYLASTDLDESTATYEIRRRLYKGTHVDDALWQIVATEVLGRREATGGSLARDWRRFITPPEGIVPLKDATIKEVNQLSWQVLHDSVDNSGPQGDPRLKKDFLNLYLEINEVITSAFQAFVLAKLLGNEIMAEAARATIELRLDGNAVYGTAMVNNISSGRPLFAQDVTIVVE